MEVRDGQERLNSLMRMRAEQKAQELQQTDQSFEAKNARAVDKITRQLAPRIQAIRVVLPAIPPVSEKHQGFLRHKTNADMIIGKCRWCEPEPKWFKCPKCDFECADRWRMWLHNVSNPRWCQDRAAKKARNWSRQA